MRSAWTESDDVYERLAKSGRAYIRFALEETGKYRVMFSNRVPLPERGPSTYGLDLPDRIVVYRLPLLEICETRRELLREIRDTVVHELGHYFGLPEEELP